MILYYYMHDLFNVNNLKITILPSISLKKAEQQFYNKFGYYPDCVSIIDKYGGILTKIKE